MRIGRWPALVVLVTALGAVTAGSSVATSSRGPTTPCRLGHPLTAADTTVENAVLGRVRTAFEHSLTGFSARARTAAGRRYVTTLAAYLYGFPTVMVRRTILTFPRNSMISIGKLADTSTVSIVAPNHDTLYSVAQIDLSAGPVVIHTPPTAGRYSVIQLTDGFTNVAAYLGDGTAARTGETAAIVAPGWHGTLPAGVRLVRPATKLLWLLGRTLAAGTADTAKATALLRQYSVTPLAAYLTGARTPPVILATFPPRHPVQPPAGTAFFDELGADLAADPPPGRDRCAIRAFARVGIGSGQTPSTRLAGLDARILTAAAKAGPGVLHTLSQAVRHEPERSLNGWSATPPDTARFGRDYLVRAVVAAIGLGANTNAKALYLTEDRDSKARALSGSHAYRVHFRAGQLPPVSAFWSLTLYDKRILFYANRLDRWALGDRSPGLQRDRDGGLTITVSHRAPAPARRSNWLPAPAGSFSLYLRLYEPKAAAGRLEWEPPSIVRVRRAVSR